MDELTRELRDTQKDNLHLKERNADLKESNIDLKESNIELKESISELKKTHSDLSSQTTVSITLLTCYPYMLHIVTYPIFLL